MLAREIRLLPDEQALRNALLITALHRLLDHVTGGHDRLPLINLRDQRIRIGMHFGEFEFGHLLKLLFGRLDLVGIKTGNLDQNATCSLRGDDRLADTEFIDALANDLDRLLQHVGGNLLPVLRNQLEQERGASPQIKTETDFLLGRGCRVEAEENQQQGKERPEPPLFSVTLGGKIPSEETEQEQSEEEGE